MFASSLLALATAMGAASAQVYQGFNYGSVFTDGSAITQPDYENEFSTAQRLVGTSGFTSARLFTMIQAGTSDTPTHAIPAAITTKTSLLLGLFLNSDQAVFDNELAALRSAISTYGQDFIDLVAGISVGSEDLYRISPIGIENNSGAGIEPAEVADYIGQVRSLIAGTAASGKVVGHVDTWTAWVNSSNDAVISACDFIGMDAYPYFQNTMSNSIDSGEALFFDAYNSTVAVAGGKPVWVTETGWPVSGPTENLGVASIENARTYWNQVACKVLGQINTWWYILQDAYPTAPDPSFGVVGTTLSTTPLYNLSCEASTSSASSPSSASPMPTIPSIIPSSSGSSALSADSASGSTASSCSTGSSIVISGGSGTAASESTSTSSLATAKGQTASGSISKPTVSVAVVIAYTTLTTCVVTYTSGSETKISLTTSAVVFTSAVGNTLSTMVQAPTATSEGDVAATNHPADSCSPSLSDTYQYPHLIVSVDKDSPNTPQGNSYNAHLSTTISSIFNFDIPPSYKGLTCSLVFLFPTQDALRTSNYTVSGNGGIDVTQLQNPATTETTYDTVPPVAADIGTVAAVQAGKSFVIASGACAAGARLGYQVSATRSLDLEYFQDYDTAPIGLYITAC